MKTQLKSLAFCLYFISCHLIVSGATVSGKITDENNEALPFASIYLQGTTQGVTSNKEGNYSIELPAGKHELVFQFIGYKKHVESVTIESANQKIILNVKMEAQPYEIGEVTVNASAEDPAYEVIRHAIKARKYYLNQVQSYSCNVYMKELIKLFNVPKKLIGIKIHVNGDDAKPGIIYLSESVSKFYFSQPDKVHEEMISSKVSGNNKMFSFNNTIDWKMNFYRNIVLEDFNRGLVSPIADGAMLYYKYHLAGVFFENGKEINKIEVIPRRNNDPVFRGYIYIMQNSWRIHSTDLYVVKDAGVEFLDTLRISQVFLPVASAQRTSADGKENGDNVWMLFSNKIVFSGSVFGLKGGGFAVSIHSKYSVKTNGSTLPEKKEEVKIPAQKKKAKKILPAEKDSVRAEKKLFSSNEEMKVDDDANKKDSSYWKDVRPIPLTAEEVLDYHKKDSAEIIHESKPYLDSVDRKSNRFRPSSLLFGYSYSQRYKKRKIEISPLIENIQFNTVQGWVGAMEFSMERRYEDEKRFLQKYSASYGVADHRWNGTGELRYTYDRKKFSSLALKGGSNTVQFFSSGAYSNSTNQSPPISPFINSLYSLLDERNYAKFYKKDFVEVSHNSELFNGFSLKAGLEYADRSPLMNTTSFSFVKKSNTTYTSNDPLNPKNDSVYSFTHNQLFEFSVNIRIHFAQKYISRPNEKWITGSKWPALFIKYRKGIPGIAGSDMNYDFVKLSVTDEINLKLLGRANYLVSAGKYLNTKNISFMDYNHFFGNQTIFSDFSFMRFELLNYYAYSTKDYFIEGHYEHDFGGFILNKLPLLRKLKLNELAGVHYLHTEVLSNYYEIFMGIEKLNIVRADFVFSFLDNKQLMTGLRLGLKLGRR